MGLLHPDGGSDRFEKNHVSRELLGLYASRAPIPPLDGFRVGAFAKTRNSLRVGVVRVVAAKRPFRKSKFRLTILRSLLVYVFWKIFVPKFRRQVLRSGSARYAPRESKNRKCKLKSLLPPNGGSEKSEKIQGCRARWGLPARQTASINLDPFKRYCTPKFHTKHAAAT